MPAFGTEPFLSADAVVMTVRAWPLVRGRIEAAGVDLDRPALRLVRAADGRWNVASLGEPPAAANGERDQRERRRTARIPIEWAIGVALSKVRDGTVASRIASGGRDRRLDLAPRAARATNVQLGATARVRLEAAVFADDAPDLRLDVHVPSLGQHDVEHAPFTARLDLRDVDLAAVRRLSGWETAVAGHVDRVDVTGEGSLVDLRVRALLHAADRGLRIGRLPLGAAAPLTLEGEGTRVGERVTIGDLRAMLGGLTMDAKGEGTIAPWRLALTVASSPGGSLALGGRRRPVHVEAVDGRIVLDEDGFALQPLRATVDGAPLEATGWITALDPAAFDLRIEGRPFGGTISADVALEASGRLRASVEATAVDSRRRCRVSRPALAGRIEGAAAAPPC